LWYKKLMRVNETLKDRKDKGQCKDCEEHMCVVCGKPENKHEVPHNKHEVPHNSKGLCGECNGKGRAGAWPHIRCEECNPSGNKKVENKRAENIAAGNCRCGEWKPDGVQLCWRCLDRPLYEQIIARMKARDGVVDLIPWFDEESHKRYRRKCAASREV
jgi:hypothetical protein